MVSATHLSASYLRLPQGQRFAIAPTAPALRFASRNPAEAGLPPRIQDHPQASHQAQPTNETIFEYHGGVEDNEQEQETPGCPQPSPRQGGGTAHNPEAQHICGPSQCKSMVEPDISAELTGLSSSTTVNDWCPNRSRTGCSSMWSAKSLMKTVCRQTPEQLHSAKASNCHPGRISASTGVAGNPRE